MSKSSKKILAKHNLMKNSSLIDSSRDKVFTSNAAHASDKLVDGTRLLTLLWDNDSRPSLRWLREQQARRAIPFIKIGARVWFRPDEVRQHLMAKWGIKKR